MPLKLTYLKDFRIPDYPDAVLALNASPLAILDTSMLSEESLATSEHISIPVGLATILYNWCPTALTAFLDLDAWFSLTWNLSVQDGRPNETRLEIGRVGNQITFGSLDKDGEKWMVMLTYNMVLDGPDRGKWVPNAKECMHGDEDVSDVEAIERLGRDFVGELLRSRRWETGKKMRHRFYVEYAPMDIWGDGINMCPHWLYESPNLEKCTTCHASPIIHKDMALQRCGRCGTATYCSEACQKRDWAVHKDICAMSMEDRGQALKITEKGGLIMWDEERMFAEGESEEESKNPNFVEPQKKRKRRVK